MPRRKEPAEVWVDGDLIKIKPFRTDDIYYLDYSDEMYKVVKGKRWTCWGRPYPMAWINGRNVLLHHLILPSKYKDGLLVDHINRDVRDNRRSNLRYVNRFESGMNRGDMSDNTSKFKGVSFHKNRKKWIAYISVNGKRKHLGYFETAEEARKKRLEAKKKYYADLL